MVTKQVNPSLSNKGSNEPVELLILGAGWTSTFLLPLLESQGVSHAATTTTGRDGSIKFKFDPESEDESPYKDLPQAQTVLITFPLNGSGQSKLLTKMYAKTHDSEPRWIQLGSSSAFQASHWNDFKSPVNESNERVKAEIELLSLGPNIVLNLAGLYGGSRIPKTWLPRIIKTRSDIKNRKALHLVHGEDVARAIVGAHRHHDKLGGSRWVVTDLHVYDWWDLMQDWADEMEVEGERLVLQQVVFECMLEDGVRALPRGPETLGRVLDSTAFWQKIETYPIMGRVK